MEATNSQFKLEFENENKDEISELTEISAVEFEIITPDKFSDARREKIAQGIADIDERLSIIDDEVSELNAEIDRLTNHADGIDYTIAVASGIISGIIDSVWVGEFSINNANKWGNEKTDSFVVKIAQIKGYSGNDLAGAVKYLEKDFPIAADKVTSDFGGGLQHHLRDFSHHPTPVGLFFSMLTQFTGNVYGTDVAGVFRIVPVDATALIGKNLPEKITFGVVNWFFHMVSDMAGSSSSAKKGKLGTGIPGPIVSFLKEVSALPMFHKMNKNGYKEFSIWISKLFNGTLLGHRDENGKLIEPVKFDLRTEIGVTHELSRQAVPVIVNECIVRGFYFLRRLFQEIKSANIECISDLKRIDWRKTLPFKNRTVARMLTISLGTFMTFDLTDAVIRSAGVNTACILRVNFVGVGRFAIAVVTDVGMGVKKRKKENERRRLLGEQIALLNTKLYFKNADLMCSYGDLYEKTAEMHAAEADLWIEVQSTAEMMEELQAIENAVASYFISTFNENIDIYHRMGSISVEGLEQNNPEVFEAIFRR